MLKPKIVCLLVFAIVFVLVSFSPDAQAWQRGERRALAAAEIAALEQQNSQPQQVVVQQADPNGPQTTQEPGTTEIVKDGNGATMVIDSPDTATGESQRRNRW